MFVIVIVGNIPQECNKLVEVAGRENDYWYQSVIISLRQWRLVSHTPRIKPKYAKQFFKIPYFLLHFFSFKFWFQASSYRFKFQVIVSSVESAHSSEDSSLKNFRLSSKKLYFYE